MNQVLLLDEVHLLYSDMVFDAQTVRFTTNTKYVDPISYDDAMSRTDAQLWGEAFDKEMIGLKKRNVFFVVQRPADRNPLGTTMLYKYKIDHVENTVNRKCRLCLRGDGKKKEWTSLNTKHIVRYLTVAKIGRCTHLQQLIIGICFLQISHRH